MLYIGIDVGTSATKLTLIDSFGKIINEVSGEYRVSEPKAGWKETNPELWMKTIEELMPKLLNDINALDVEAIGVTGQMHTLIILDQHDVVIRPALMWNDRRTKEMIQGMKKKIQAIPNIDYISGIISTGSPASNLLWIKENEEDKFKRINKFLIGPDYIVFRLTGNYQTDYCEASTSSLFDFKKKTWSKDILNLFGFPESIFPPIKGTMEIAGMLKEEWSKKFGMSNTVKVIVGTGDNPAAAISTGCFTKHYPVLSIGTSGVLIYPKSIPDFKIKGKNILFSFDSQNISVLVQGSIQSAGNSMSWWTKDILQTKNFFNETNYEDINYLGENTLLFYPHLVGDKTIYGDPTLTGAFLGLQTNTTRKEMTIAIMEGVSMAVKQLSDAMGIPKEQLEGLRVTGGGSKNDVWMQILADVLNVSVQQLESGTSAGYGIALAAASACNTEVSIENMINHTVRVKKVFIPREYNKKLYQGKYEKYLKLYKALKYVYCD